MSFDLWTHQFCLACDKQVHDGEAYCSESCRLSDFEKTPSSPTSRASSPGVSAPPSWAAPAPALVSKPSKPALFLAPAYDFTNAQPYGTTPTPKPLLSHYASLRTDRPARSLTAARQLTPSSSHASLCSMQSTASDASRLSDVAKKELQAYAVSFEQVRVQRRRSY